MSLVYDPAILVTKALHKWAMQQTEWPLFKQDDPSSVASDGVGLYVRKLTDDDPHYDEHTAYGWISKHPDVIEKFAKGIYMPGEIAIGVAIVWRSVFAAFIDEKSRTRELAWSVLLAMLDDPEYPLEHFDPVLAHYARRYPTLWRQYDATSIPTKLRRTLDTTRLLVNLHITRLLDYQKFFDVLAVRLNRAMSDVATTLRSRVGHCGNGTGCALQVCSVCAQRKWCRTGTNVFLPAKAGASPLRKMQVPDPDPQAAVGSSWQKEFHLWLHMTSDEGVTMDGPWLLLEPAKLIEMADVTDRVSLVRRFLDVTARGAVDEYVDAARRFRDAFSMRYVVEFPEMNELEFTSPLTLKLHKKRLLALCTPMQRRVARTAMAKHVSGAKKKLAPRTLETYTTKYVNPDGDTTELKLLWAPDTYATRHGHPGARRWYVELTEAQRVAARNVAAQHGRIIDEKLYVNSDFLTARFEREEDPVWAALGRVLKDWAHKYPTAASVSRLRKEVTTETRLAMATPGQIVKSKYATATELAALEELRLMRLGQCRSFNDIELDFIRSHFPNRELRTIKRWFDELGFAYALKTSFLAYTTSGYAFQRSHSRRLLWGTKGVKFAD